MTVTVIIPEMPHLAHFGPRTLAGCEAPSLDLTSLCRYGSTSLSPLLVKLLEKAVWTQFPLFSFSLLNPFRRGFNPSTPPGPWACDSGVPEPAIHCLAPARSVARPHPSFLLGSWGSWFSFHLTNCSFFISSAGSASSFVTNFWACARVQSSHPDLHLFLSQSQWVRGFKYQ